jgi:hypothetical protein
MQYRKHLSRIWYPIWVNTSLPPIPDLSGENVFMPDEQSIKYAGRQPLDLEDRDLTPPLQRVYGRNYQYRLTGDSVKEQVPGEGCVSNVLAKALFSEETKLKDSRETED